MFRRFFYNKIQAIRVRYTKAEILEEMILKVSHVEKLLAIKGVGSITIAGFIAEVGEYQTL